MQSGTEAHVLAMDHGVCLQDEDVDMLMYDDGTMLLLVVKGGVVFAFDLSIDAPGSHEQLAWTYPIPEGPKPLSMRCSLDRQLLAIQRTTSQLEIADLHRGQRTVLSSYKGQNAILGYFFSEDRSAEIVLVTPAGLELCQLGARGPEGRLSGGIRVTDRIKIGVNWFVYTHETRCCMVATGPPGGTYIQAWQFVTAGMLTLPPFIVGAGPTGTEVRGHGPAHAPGTTLPAPLPPAPMVLPPGLLTAFGGVSLRPDVSDKVLRGAGTSFGSSGTHNSVRLLKMYGRVYCAHINTAQSRLELYRFYTDTVVLQHSYEIFSKKVELSTVDNVLVVHHRDSAVTLLFDVNANTSEPISLPLPVGLLAPCSATPQGGGAQGPPASKGSGGASDEISAKPPRGEGPHRSSILGNEALSDWVYCSPNVAISQSGKAAYRLYLDLSSLVDSSSGDIALLAGFLQRRRQPSCQQLNSPSPKELLLKVVRSALQERRTPMHVLREMFDNLSKGWADMYRLATSNGHVAPSAVVSLVSPSDLATQVFQWLHDEEVVDVPFLSAALSEYAASADSAGLPPLPHLQALSTELLLLQSQPDQAAQATYLALADPATSAVAAAVVTASTSASESGSGKGSSSKGKGSKNAAVLASPATSTAALVAMACLSEVADKLEHCGHSESTSATALTLRTKVAVLSAGCPSTAPASSIGKIPAEQHVRALLAKGNILKACQTARRLGVVALSSPDAGDTSASAGTATATATAPGTRLPAPNPVASNPVQPLEFLTAAAKTGDLRVFAAVYRFFRPHLARTYPKLEVAKSQLGFREIQASAA